MRTGVCSVQQALTVEAASIVKQAIAIARRRGHAQVTPLHVSSAMLAASTCILKRACFQCHSHPLQSKALELCFNVALNRLPASISTSSTAPFLLGSKHEHYFSSAFNPSLSNALIAAFKRAQAQQRRGSVENQQQPILAMKIELEQLVISILDDPSVSRVMREAGFSSTLVKNKVEQAVSLEISNILPKETTKPNQILIPFGSKQPFFLDESTRNDGVTTVLHSILQKKRNSVVTGECVASCESVVRGVMEKLDQCDPKFISFPLFTLRYQLKEEVEKKLVELRCNIVETYKATNSQGVVLYLGDIKWVAEFWSSYGGHQQRRSYNYHSSYIEEFIVMEIKRLVSENGKKLWLLGIATFHTYMKCKAGYPSLDSIWDLSPVTIPVGSLSLSLNFESDSQLKSSTRACKNIKESSNWLLPEADCAVNGIETAGSFRSIAISSRSSLPSWLQQYKEESSHRSNNNSDLKEEAFNVGNIWKQSKYLPEKTIKFASTPPSPTSISSPEFNPTHLSWPLIVCNSEEKQSSVDQSVWLSKLGKSDERKPDLLSNPNSSPNSASSSEATEEDPEALGVFKEMNEANLKLLQCELESKVLRYKDVVPDIATAILECRSGTKSGRKVRKEHQREDCWLLFSGPDFGAKEKIAKELARVIFGSHSNFVSISLSNDFSSKKRKRLDETSCSKTCLEKLGLALNEKPHRVFFLEDMEQLNYWSLKEFEKTIRNGEVTLPEGENVPVKDAIIIFSSLSESFSSVTSTISARFKKQKLDDEETESKSAHSFDLNIAIEDSDNMEDDGISVAEHGILEYLDRHFIFKA